MFEDLTTIELIIAVAGAILLVLGFTGAGKTRKMGKTFLVLGAVGLGVVFALPYFGYDPFGGNGEMAIGGGGNGASSIPGTTLCAVEDTTVTLTSVDSYTESATGGTHRYRINGNPSLGVADAGTLTASPGDRIEILWMNEAHTGYFGAVDSEIVPCAGTKTFSTRTSQNGTLTFDIFSRDAGDTIRLGLANQSMTNGDVFTLASRITGQFERNFPYGGVVVAEYNGTAFDDVIVDFGGGKTSVPDFYTVSRLPNNVKAYIIPAVIGTQDLDGSVTIDADDTVDPMSTTGGDSIGTGILFHFYPNDYFINNATGGSFEGPAVQDEDGEQIRGAYYTEIHIT